jgi:hypothetical protein
LHKFFKSLLASISAVVLALGVFTQSAYAANPHFINTSASLANNGNLQVNFKEAGLGTNQNVDLVASADGTADYACINKGGKNPSASNKETVSGPVAAGGTFSSGQNGQINSSLTLQPPSAGDFSCPSGQRLVLASVTYSNVAITDTTNNVSESIGGTFTKIFFTF